MKNYMKTIISALQMWIRNEYVKSTDEEIIEMLAQEDTLVAVADGDGAILTTEGSVILW